MASTTGGARQTRNADRTRAAILTAAASALAEQGTGASLASIAKRAGVSKGGLLHHFTNRDALIVALIDDANRKFRESVLSHLDLSENTPGKMLRAYVRALCSGDEGTAQYFTSTPSWRAVYDVPEVAQILREASGWWAEQLGVDGIPAERILLVRRAAEGMAVALAYGEETPDRAATARDMLLRFTETGSLPD